MKLTALWILVSITVIHADQILLKEGLRGKIKLIDTNGCFIMYERNGNIVNIKKDKIAKLIISMDTISYENYTCTDMNAKPLITNNSKKDSLVTVFSTYQDKSIYRNADFSFNELYILNEPLVYYGRIMLDSLIDNSIREILKDTYKIYTISVDTLIRKLGSDKLHYLMVISKIDIRDDRSETLIYENSGEFNTPRLTSMGSPWQKSVATEIKENMTVKLEIRIYNTREKTAIYKYSLSEKKTLDKYLVDTKGEIGRPGFNTMTEGERRIRAKKKMIREILQTCSREFKKEFSDSGIGIREE